MRSTLLANSRVLRGFFNFHSRVLRGFLIFTPESRIFIFIPGPPKRLKPGPDKWPEKTGWKMLTRNFKQGFSYETSTSSAARHFVSFACRAAFAAGSERMTARQSYRIKESTSKARPRFQISVNPFSLTLKGHFNPSAFCGVFKGSNQCQRIVRHAFC